MGKHKKIDAPVPDIWTIRHDFPDVWQVMSGQSLRVEEFRDEGSIVVRAEVPGVDPDRDIEVTVAGGVLTIRAQRSQGSTHEGDHRYHSEFRYGSFTRRVPLPGDAVGDDVKASYRDGILEVRIPVDAHDTDILKVPVHRA